MPDNPLRKGHETEAIVSREEEETSFLIAYVMDHDPTWEWLHDGEEDLYTDRDLEESYR